MSAKPNTKKKVAPAAAKKKTHTLLIIIAVLLAITLSVVYLWQQSKVNKLTTQVTDLQSQLDQRPVTAYTSAKDVTIKLFTPTNGAKISSPLTVVGMVPGSWTQEANFTVKLKNSKGDIVAQSAAQLHGDWMTENLRPFTSMLTYATAESGQGTLILQAANPSGQADKDDSVTIPVEL